MDEGVMKVRVEFYGRLKRDAGLESREIELDEGGSTVADLLAHLRSGVLAEADGVDGLESVVVAVGDRVANPRRTLRDGDVVGLLPPVSGG